MVRRNAAFLDVIGATLRSPIAIGAAASTCARRRWTHQAGVKMTGARMDAASAPVHPDSLQVTWSKFAENMKNSGEVPPLESWHELLDGSIRSNDKPSLAIWLLNLMRDTGIRPSATTYEKMLTICDNHNDRVAAFHLVENMCKDKVLLDDVELPAGLADILRSILPPDVF